MNCVMGRMLSGGQHTQRTWHAAPSACSDVAAPGELTQTATHAVVRHLILVREHSWSQRGPLIRLLDRLALIFYEHKICTAVS